MPLNPDLRALSTDSSPRLEFVRVPLMFEGDACSNIFAMKNNKTLAQTLDHPRYAHLRCLVLPQHAPRLEMPLGSFLLELKREGDACYRRFLNKYGDLAYLTFAISERQFLNVKGVYSYYVGEELQYIGRCKDSMRQRVNQGYGKIHPKNCYLDGQATNCRLNALITQLHEKVSLWISLVQSDTKIEEIEAQLIRQYSPSWNIQKP